MATTVRQERDALKAEIKAYVDKVKAEGREPSAADSSSMRLKLDRLKNLNEQIRATEESQQMIANIRAEEGLGTGNGSNYLLLSGAGRKSLIDGIADKMTAVDGTGRKALLPVGETAISIPMLPSDPISLTAPSPALLGVLPSVVIPSGSKAQFLVQSTRTNNAAVVATGAVKPTSIYSLTPAELSLAVFAHLSEPTDRFLLEDADALARFIVAELVAGLTKAVEASVLATILATSGIQLSGPGDDLLGTMRTALTALTVAGFDQDIVFVMSAAAWETAETSKAVTSGNFLMPSAPVDSAARRVWGTPVVVATGLPANTALALDRTALALYTDRQGIRTDWGSPSDQWTRNQVTARCEGRFALAVTQPLGIVKITTPAVV